MAEHRVTLSELEHVRPEDVDVIGSFYSELKAVLKHDKDALVEVVLTYRNPDGKHRETGYFRMEVINLVTLIEMVAEELIELRRQCPPTED
jgi:hypothetical protein